MIFERTMMFGFTFRSDIPTRSISVTLASENLAWIQRLKYFASRTKAISSEEADDGQEARARRTAMP